MARPANGFITESYAEAGAGFGAGDATADGGGMLGTSYATPGGPDDYRMPQIVMPMLRRVFPALLAHGLVAVQPMHGPVGIAFAMRFLYGKKGTTSVSGVTGEEIGYNKIHSDFTGGSVATPDDGANGPGTNEFWEAYAGAGVTARGTAVDTEEAEWWDMKNDMPNANVKLMKAPIIAKSRKFGTSYSLEAAEDMMYTQGVDIDAEMVSALSRELKNQVDRELLDTIVTSAIEDTESCSTWDPIISDGRHQLERISTLATHMLMVRQKVAVRTRIGSANFAVGSPNVIALIERLVDFKQDGMGADGTVSTDGAAETTFVGTLRGNSIKVYRDIFANGEYVLQGLKGAGPNETGVVYLPYIPAQLMRAKGSDTYNPRLAIRTRYGLHSNMFGTSNFYQLTAVKNLASNIAAETSRVFTS
jgi:hypothetical protein